MNLHTASGDDYYDDMRKKYSEKQNTSNIPPHLSEEELEEWMRELEEQKKDKKERSKKGPQLYGSTKKTKLKKRRNKK